MASEAEYRATAAALAQAHKNEDPQTSDVFLIPDAHFATVRLLEVSGAAPRSGDVLPFSFSARPDLGIRFPSTVILLSPDEWKDVLAGTLALPPGWDVTKREKL